MTIIAIRPQPVADDREASAVFSKTFDNERGIDFAALNDAQAFLIDRGFSFGSPCIGCPQGVMYGRWQIAKWRNLTHSEITGLHGVVSGDRRKGPIKVSIFWNAPAFAIAAVAQPYLTKRLVDTWSQPSRGQR